MSFSTNHTMENQHKVHHFPDTPKGILDRKPRGHPTVESQRLKTIRMRQAEAIAGHQVSAASILPVLRALDDQATFPLNGA